MTQYECQHCGKMFKCEKYLHQHLKRKNPCLKRTECEYCGKEFPKSSSKQSIASHRYRCKKKHIDIIESHAGCSLSDSQLIETSEQTDSNTRELVNVIQKLHDKVDQLDVEGTTHHHTTNHNENIQVNIVINPYNDSKNKNLLDLNKTIAICSKYRHNPLPHMIEEAHINDETNRNVRPLSKSKAVPSQDWEIFDGVDFVRRDFNEILDTFLYQASNSLSDIALDDTIECNENIKSVISTTADKICNTFSSLSSRESYCEGQETFTQDHMNKLKKDICRVFHNAMIKKKI